MSKPTVTAEEPRGKETRGMTGEMRVRLEREKRARAVEERMGRMAGGRVGGEGASGRTKVGPRADYVLLPPAARATSCSSGCYVDVVPPLWHADAIHAIAAAT